MNSFRCSFLIIFGSRPSNILHRMQRKLLGRYGVTSVDGCLIATTVIIFSKILIDPNGSYKRLDVIALIQLWDSSIIVQIIKLYPNVLGEFIGGVSWERYSDKALTFYSLGWDPITTTLFYSRSLYYCWSFNIFVDVFDNSKDAAFLDSFHLNSASLLLTLTLPASNPIGL